MLTQLAYKRPMIEAGGNVYARKTQHKFTASVTISGVFCSSVFLRGGGGGGSGAKTYYNNDGEAGSNGSETETPVFSVNGSADFVRGGPGFGGNREDTESTINPSQNGGSGSASTFASYSASGGSGGAPVSWDFPGSGRSPSALSPPNPDASNGGRGGAGGDASNVNATLRNGRPGEIGAMWITFED